MIVLAIFMKVKNKVCRSKISLLSIKNVDWMIQKWGEIVYEEQ